MAAAGSHAGVKAAAVAAAPARPAGGSHHGTPMPAPPPPRGGTSGSNAGTPMPSTKAGPSGSFSGGSSVDISISDLQAGGPSATECPACKAPLLPGAVACMDCGYMLASADSAAPETEEAPIICANPACGVANPRTAKNCVRCDTVLPTPPGTMIKDRYKIEKQLAVGGFGAVYLATDTKGGAQVAIKDMICEDPQEFTIRLNFFRREAEILKMLEVIPIVPRVYELIEKGEAAHLILEFIRGKDLMKIMEANNNKGFEFEDVIKWGKDICDVLSHMHNQQPPLVHRDLKPDNIMLLEDKKTIKMIDFGTARDVGKNQKERAQAKTKVYTEGYAPPEQIIGKPEPRSDLFALAGTLYHLLTGKAPEGYHTAEEIKAQLPSTPPQQKWFYELMMINLAEDLNERYFSAKEFKVDLEKRQVSKEKPCPKCQTKNEVRKPYCMKCAGPMTDVIVLCNQCGKNNLMGGRFCIYCGNRLR
jgi:hypothetical protein